MKYLNQDKERRNKESNNKKTPFSSCNKKQTILPYNDSFNQFTTKFTD